MASLQRRSRRTSGQAVKVVVTGPFAAGKSTLIRTISEITVLSTERAISDETIVRKSDTTVAMDFGRISIDSDLVLYLFGTPGQERFDFMWEILSEGMLGFILLIDASRPDTLDQAAVILERFRGLSRSPFVVALNRTESVGWMSPEDVRTTLQLEADVPVVPCDATDRESVKSVLLSLLYSALDLVEDQAAHA